MKYPIAYKADELTFSGYGLGILDEAWDVVVNQRLGGEYTLSLKVPASEKVLMFLDEIEYIKVEETVFAVRQITYEKSDEPMEVELQCEHIYYELLNNLVRYKEYLGVSLKDILTDLIPPTTRFKVASWVNDTVGYDFEFIDKSVYQCILDILDVVGGELVPANMPDAVDNKFTIGIKIPVYDNFTGAYMGGGLGSIKKEITLRIGKNINRITKEVDKSNFFTRVYYSGYEGINFAGHTVTVGVDGTPLATPIPLPAGQDYLEIGGYTGAMREGIKQFSEIKDLNELYWAARSHFRSVKSPEVRYDIEVLDVHTLPEFYGFDKFEVGDTIQFFDDDLVGTNTAAMVRVTEYTRRPLEPEKSKAKFETAAKNIFYTFAEFSKATTTVGTITDLNGKVKTTEFKDVYMVEREIVGGVGGHYMFDSTLEGLLIARDKPSASNKQNCILIRDNGDIFIFNRNGVGIEVNMYDNSVRYRDVNGIGWKMLTTESKLEDLYDVTYGTLGAGDVGKSLKWNGSAWFPSF